ncbi:MAG: succinate dehydrogenase assembly factor 2 [Candidatus Methylumidiphilus sp.]
MAVRAQLEWRCRRGTKELDLLLQNWLRVAFDGAAAAERQTFLALLDWPDDALIRLLLGPEQSADPQVDALAAKIRSLPLPRP